MDAIKKSDIFPLAEKVADEFDNWQFITNKFKNKTLKHTTLLVVPLFYFRNGFCSGNPAFAINNNSINKLYKEATGEPLQYWTLSYRITPKAPQIDEFSGIRDMRRTIMTMEHDNPEGWIRAFLKRGIEQIHETFDLSSEAGILSTLPEVYHGLDAAIVSIAKCMLGDFDFVFRLHAGEIVDPDEHPFNEELLEAVMKKIPEWKKLYDEQGYILKPLK